MKRRANARFVQVGSMAAIIKDVKISTQFCHISETIWIEFLQISTRYRLAFVLFVQIDAGCE